MISSDLTDVNSAGFVDNKSTQRQRMSERLYRPLMTVDYAEHVIDVQWTTLSRLGLQVDHRKEASFISLHITSINAWSSQNYCSRRLDIIAAGNTRVYTINVRVTVLKVWVDSHTRQLFLANRTVTVAFMIQCCVRLSSVTLCIVAKRCIPEKKVIIDSLYRKSYMRNRLVPK